MRPPPGVEERLAAAERELNVQFARIAQIQAELDLLAATIRRLQTDPRQPIERVALDQAEVSRRAQRELEEIVPPVKDIGNR